MSKNGKRYTDEFKADAIRLVREGRSISSVATDLGVNPQTLRNWAGTRSITERIL
jgi:transposase